jgi:hypothetical protein
MPSPTETSPPVTPRRRFHQDPFGRPHRWRSPTRPGRPAPQRLRMRRPASPSPIPIDHGVDGCRHPSQRPVGSSMDHLVGGSVQLNDTPRRSCESNPVTRAPSSHTTRASPNPRRQLEPSRADECGPDGCHRHPAGRCRLVPRRTASEPSYSGAFHHPRPHPSELGAFASAAGPHYRRTAPRPPRHPTAASPTAVMGDRGHHRPRRRTPQGTAGARNAHGTSGLPRVGTSIVDKPS